MGTVDITMFAHSNLKLNYI